MEMQIEGIEYSKTLGPWIAKTFKMLESYVETVLVENYVPISKRQQIALNIINSNTEINQKQLAHFLNRDKTSVARFVATLEKNELIKKECDSNDKRNKQLFLTKKGKTILNETTPIIKKVALNLQNELSEKDIKNTIASLKKIQEKIKKLHKDCCPFNKQI